MNADLVNLCATNHIHQLSSRTDNYIHQCGATVNLKRNEDDCVHYFEWFGTDGRQCAHRIDYMCNCKTAQLESDTMAVLEGL